MAEPLLTEIFGANATQTATTLTITKADFVVNSLTPLAANTAESLLVAILLKCRIALTEEARLTNLPLRNVTAVYSGQDLIDQGGTNIFLRDTLQVSMYRLTTISAIDPDNY